jgi:hypothetical protein
MNTATPLAGLGRDRRLPDLIHKAKVYAAECDTCIKTPEQGFLEQTVSSRDRTRTAGALILEIARREPHSVVDPASIRREKIHERW